MPCGTCYCSTSNLVGKKNSTLRKLKVTAFSPITSWQIEGENSGNRDRLYFGGVPKSLLTGIAVMKLKDMCCLERKL